MAQHKKHGENILKSMKRRLTEDEKAEVVRFIKKRNSTKTYKKQVQAKKPLQDIIEDTVEATMKHFEKKLDTPITKTCIYHIILEEELRGLERWKRQYMSSLKIL